MASHALLWGSRGTGKSSLVKAALNAFFDDGLRLIEFFKEDLGALTDISDEIRELPYKFIIFCDDISFEIGDSSYKALKSVIEGSIELPPKNVLVYATSNRRHLIPEFHADNDGTIISQGEIHYSDNVEEKISLSDRFGLWLSFYQGSVEEYLRIVDSYFPALDEKRRAAMHEEAKRFASLRASRSGRAAKQFFTLFADKF
jgi:predicted AAA+ superfamily ATPase